MQNGSRQGSARSGGVFRRAVCSAALCGASLMLAAGCGRVSHGDRVPLAGMITKGGKPLEDKATIYFDPVDGKAGVGSIGEVSNSRYSIPPEAGPTPGLKYKVRVITAPGIPTEGTPKDQIRLPQNLETVVEIPPRESGGQSQLDIDFE